MLVRVRSSRILYHSSAFILYMSEAGLGSQKNREDPFKPEVTFLLCRNLHNGCVTNDRCFESSMIG